MPLENSDFTKDNLANDSYLTVTANVLESFNLELQREDIIIDDKIKVLQQVSEAYSMYSRIKTSTLESDQSIVEQLKIDLDNQIKTISETFTQSETQRAETFTQNENQRDQAIQTKIEELNQKVQNGDFNGQDGSDANIPVGTIVMWGKLISEIPIGWNLCDGTKGTPDLRTKFIYGASTDEELLNTGGYLDSQLPLHSHTSSVSSNGSHTHTANHSHSASSSTTGAHTHGLDQRGSGDNTAMWHRNINNSKVATSDNSVTTNTDQYSVKSSGNHSHSISVNSASVTTSSNGSHNHSVTINNSGSDVSGKNLPPYIKLAYIMKIEEL